MKTPVYLLFALFFALLACTTSPKKTNDRVKSAEKMNNPNDELKKDDSDFLVAAANGGMMEVELGHLAQTYSSNARVKKFGVMMMKDHSQANEELKALAIRKKVTLPAALGEDYQKDVDYLTRLKGADFDADYIKMVVRDHKKYLREFEEAAAKANDADIKAFAEKTLPLLRQHLDLAREIRKTLNAMEIPRTI